MSALLSCQSLTKTHSARPLFDNISFGIEDGNRIGLIGPNGSGKSTLLRILAGLEKPDSGTVSVRSGVRLRYVPQEENFPTGQTVEQVLRSAFAGAPLDESEKAVRLEMLYAQIPFPDREQNAATLSGGWRKRLAIAHGVLQEPDVLLLDEPTNHLDLDGVRWLEEFLENASFGYLVISHDRYFLENTVRRVIELNPAYEGGFLSSVGTYSDFLVTRDEYFARQAQQQQSLASVVRHEVEWLKRGARARTTKAKGRIDQAGQLISDLNELKYRNSQVDAQVSALTFSASGRQTKEMVVLQKVRKSLGERLILADVEMTLSPRRRVGVVGPNGSGKTTLLRVITGELEADSGTVRRADNLRIVWFEQNRTSLNRDQTLKDALSPNSDYVEYRGSKIHVNSWAKRFLFRADQLPQSVSALSGGEQARLLIAQLMLQPADMLILDEPTNDLDIPTLDILTESLLGFPGSVVLVTHDRYLLDQVATEVVGLMGNGEVLLFADREQYEIVRQERAAAKVAPPPPAVRQSPTVTRVSLSTAERRELAQIEAKIEEAETRVADLEAALQTPDVATNALRLQDTWAALEEAKKKVAAFYDRWEELEAKQRGQTG